MSGGQPQISRNTDSKDTKTDAQKEIDSELYDIYCEFSEAYFEAEESSEEIDPEIFKRLINRVMQLTADIQTDRPETYALLSHILLESSRLPAMTGASRDLKSQDRKLWDRVFIEQGLSYLKHSAEGNAVTLYHLKAAVSACHSLAKDWGSTDWKHILSLYDSYLELNDSPEIALERTQVLARFKGPRAEIKGLEEMLLNYQIDNGHLLYDKLGDLRCRLHEYRQALESYEKALEEAETKADKSKYRKKIRYCKTRLSFKDKYAQGLSF